MQNDHFSELINQRHKENKDAERYLLQKPQHFRIELTSNSRKEKSSRNFFLAKKTKSLNLNVRT